MTLIFDTGSSWLWVPTTDCKDCHSKAQLYDQKQSSNYVNSGTRPQHIKYGAGSVWGYKSTDLLCLDSTNNQETCLNNFNFLAVFVASDLSGLQCDGIVGLSPSNQFSGSDLFIDKLYQNNIISKKMFSLSLGGTDEKSKVIFGGYDLRYAKDNQNITWNKLIDTNYWSVRLNKAKIGDYVFMLDTNRAIIDSGTSYILMPYNDFSEFKRVIDSINSKCGMDAQTNLYTCQCVTQVHSDFPNIEITLGENTYTIPSTSYMHRQNFKCYFRVLPQSYNQGIASFWILGDVFMINYYSIFDIDNQRVGLVGSVHVEIVSYWRDIVMVLSILMAFTGGVILLLSFVKDKYFSQQIKVPRTLEFELTQNPKNSYDPVKLDLDQNKKASINTYQNQ
eukprot:403375303